jgi:hypothetical protein
MLALLAAAVITTAPVRLIIDTDMGNDIDDVIALALAHRLQDLGECEILAVTASKPDPLSAQFCGSVNAYFDRPKIAVGEAMTGPKTQDGGYLPLALVYPGGAKPQPAVALLRKTLAEQPDGSVTIVQIGFSTNLSDLLETKPDAHSSLSGRDLVRKKVKTLSLMAGAFTPVWGNDRHLEYNVVKDIASARNLAEEWPTPMVFSGFEIGLALPFPLSRTKREGDDLIEDACRIYDKTLGTRPSWDQTSVLQAVRPKSAGFKLSPPGRVIIEPDGFTRFTPKTGGSHRYLIVPKGQNEAIIKQMERLYSAEISIATDLNAGV